MARILEYAGLLLLACCSITARGIERQAILPERPAALIRIADLSELKQSLNRMVLDELMADDRFQEFSSALTDKIRRKRAEGKIPLNLQLLYDLLLQVQGEAVFTIAGSSADAAGETFYLAAALRESDYRESLQRSEWTLREANVAVTVQTGTFQDHELVRFLSPGDEDPEASCWIAYIEGTVLLSHDREWIEECLVRLSRETVEEPEHAGLHGSVPLAPWIRAAIEKETDPDKRTAMENLYRALGLLEIGNLSLDIAYGDGNLTIDFRLEVEDLSKGLFTLLNPSPAEEPLAGLIPDGASSYSAGNFNLQAFWQALPALLGQISPEASLQFQPALQAFRRTTGADLQHDLIDHLGSSFATYSILRGTNQHFIAAIALRDGPAMKTALDGIFAFPAMQPYSLIFSSTDFRGHTLYGNAGPLDNASAPAFCVARNYLLIGSIGSLRESILGMENPESAVIPSLQQKAADYIPPTAFLHGATDHRKTMALLTIIASDSKLSFSAGIQAGGKAGAPQEPLGDGEISLNYIGSFLHDSCYFMEKTETGLHHRIVLINPGTKE